MAMKDNNDTEDLKSEEGSTRQLVYSTNYRDQKSST